MRILMLSWEYPPHSVGGMGRHVTDLVRCLVEQGVEVHLVTPLLRGGKRREILDGVHIYRVLAPSMADYSFVPFVRQTNIVLERAARRIQKKVGEIELIHAHDWLCSQAAVALKQAWHRPLITTIHATERGRQQGHISTAQSDEINSLEWWISYESWRVIACSRFMAQQIHNYFNIGLDKIDVISNGVIVQAPPFSNVEERLTFRRRFVSDEDPLVFYVGRVVYEKGVHLLVNAWPRILATFPKARLVIAGTGDNLESVKHQARALGLQQQVMFAGFISDEDRQRLYATANLAVFPSIYEPFGIVALEAMAASCPVVVASTGGLAEVVQLHETGLTIYPNNIDSLVWGITNSLQHPEWARQRAANALRDVHNQYGWPEITSQTIKVYERTIAEWRMQIWGAELVSTQKNTP